MRTTLPRMMSAALALVAPSLLDFCASRPADASAHARVFYILFLNGARLPFSDFGGPLPERAASGEGEPDEDIRAAWGAPGRSLPGRKGGRNPPAACVSSL